MIKGNVLVFGNKDIEVSLVDRYCHFKNINNAEEIIFHKDELEAIRFSLDNDYEPYYKTLEFTYKEYTFNFTKCSKKEIDHMEILLSKVSTLTHLIC